MHQSSCSNASCAACRYLSASPWSLRTSDSSTMSSLPVTHLPVVRLRARVPEVLRGVDLRPVVLLPALVLRGVDLRAGAVFFRAAVVRLRAVVFFGVVLFLVVRFAVGAVFFRG